jgi:Trypsin-like peptidase domain
MRNQPASAEGPDAAVPHFLDAMPLDFSHPGVQDVLGTLTENYYAAKQVLPLLKDAKISPADVDLEKPMSQAWYDILEVARKQDKLRNLLGVVARSSDAAVAHRIDELVARSPVVAAPTDAGAIDWVVDPADAEGLERQIEDRTSLLDISFLERGPQLAPSVARLLVTLSDGKYYGTGFRIGDDLLLTNHHVLFDAAGPATKVEAWFGYERSFGGADRAHLVVDGLPDSIQGRSEHDWAVVRVGSPLPEAAEVLPVTGAPPPKPLDRVYIIQHPSGGVKKIGMIHNVVVNVTDDLVQYRTDTEGGSSGSPVFDESWRVVALHHRWGSRTVAGRREYFNQGQRIERVVEGLQAEGLM